jgi:hypothetical protein
LGFPSTLWSFRSKPRRKRLSIPTATLFEFGLRLELHRRHLVGLPKQGQHLSWALLPFSTFKERRSTFRGLCLPATFRPQGLVTLSTVSSLRTLAGFVSRRQRSWDSPFGAFPSREASVRFRTHEPTYRFTARLGHREAATQPVRPRFLGFDPPKSPWRSAALLARRPLDAPLGFAPSKVFQPKPCGGFRHHSSSALPPPPNPMGPTAPAP